jgi:hypothetical protein
MPGVEREISAAAAVLGRRGGLAKVPKGSAVSAGADAMRAMGAAARSIPTACKGCGAICPSGRSARAHCVRSR